MDAQYNTDQSIRKFVFGDLHGQFFQFVKSLEHVERQCQQTPHEIILAGDPTNGGKWTWRLMEFIKTRPNIRVMCGNNDAFFYSGIMENIPAMGKGLKVKDMGMMDALELEHASQTVNKYFGRLGELLRRK